MSKAMPDGPRSRAAHRALFHGLGLSASIAIALSGCMPAYSAVCVRKADGEHFAVRAYADASGRHVEAYQFSDRNGFTVEITEKDSAQWDCQPRRK